LTTCLRQKIAELVMIANKSPGVIDWTVIPDNLDTSILDEYMDIDSQQNEWKDVIEDDLTIDMQDGMDTTTAARHARLQTTIMCVVPHFPALFFSFLNCTVALLVAAGRAMCHARGFYDAVLLRESGTSLCHPLSIHILHGNPPVLRLAPRSIPTSYGQYLC
jgi:hypothetical protein